MDATSRPQALDEVERRLVQAKMEEFSLTKDAAADPRAAARLTALRAEMGTLEGRQRALADRWREEKGALEGLNSLKAAIEQKTLEIEQAEAAYELNKAAELKYRDLPELQAQLRAKQEALAAADGGEALTRTTVGEEGVAAVGGAGVPSHGAWLCEQARRTWRPWCRSGQACRSRRCWRPRRRRSSRWPTSCGSGWRGRTTRSRRWPRRSSARARG
mmetsp:Transcript_32172/g.94833  ORF Transcript_32172/g.94833 Transcript_32172/m.94833 type:complete len:217 (+) Transcript_32172:1617-2267(+)